MPPRTDRSRQPPETPTRQALWHLATCVVYVALFAGAAYAYPVLSRFKPWMAGDPWPILRMFQERTAVPGFAEAAAHGGRDTLDELRRNLGDIVLANLGEDEGEDGDPVLEPGGAHAGAGAGGAEDAPGIAGKTDTAGKGAAKGAWTAGDSRPGAPPTDGAVASRGLSRRSAREPGGSEQEATGSGPGSASQASRRPRPAIDPSEFENIAQPIENPQALRRFFAKLRRTAAGRAGAITRVAHYGDSAVAADAISRTARRRLQRRFGDAGHGFILIAKGAMHYAHADVQLKGSDGWSLYSIVRSQLRNGRYGYGGIQARAFRPQYASFSTSEKGPVGRQVSRFELFYQRFPQGGDVLLRVDQDREHQQRITTAANTIGPGYAVLEAADGPHTLHLWTRGGEVRLYGVAMEREGPGVVYDALGLVGARAQRLLNADREHISRQIAHRKPDLLVLGFGGNEAGSKWLELERYEADLRQVIDTMRAGHDADCLLFGPLDQAERDSRGRIVTIPKLFGIVEVQRRVAREKNCAFYDTFTAMGGEGTFERWYRSRPQLASSDFRHATPDGYRVIGNLYYKALLKAYAEDSSP